jgi:hypothetical protein
MPPLPTDSFKIKLNQNLWGLVVAYAALGIAEHWRLRWLFRLSLVVAICMTVSVLVTTVRYTLNYWRD